MLTSQEMPVKVSVYIATSLDGFIAGKDGELDWLNESNATVPRGEDCGFKAFLDSVDTIVMGRKTYETVLSFGEWPYEGKPIVVLSRNAISFPPNVPNTVTHSSDAPQDLLERLADEGAERVYVDGGITIQRFLSEGLVDEFTVTTIPVILGDGIPLFGSLEKSINLTHMRTTIFDFGFVQTKYMVKKND